jgi:glutathione S-transferase
MIELLTAATPNGQKISIALEELGIPYKVTSISLQDNKQKEPSFLNINPNGRIPAIVDQKKSSGFPVFESGAILLYLTDHYDPTHRLSYAPEDWEHRSELLQWLFFQNAGIGPMQGQANHFFRYAREKIPYAIERYQTETKRLYGVLEERLMGQGDWLVGNKYTIADISCFAWVRWAAWAGVELGEFPKVREWAERIEERKAVKRGLKVPDAEDTIERLRKGDERDEWGAWVRKQK